MASYLGVDIGTSSIKAVLLDDAQRMIAEASAPLDVLRLRPLWSEQDPQAWWYGTLSAIAALRAAAPTQWRELAAIGLSGQQHGATVLDAQGRVLRPCILWNDGRSQAQCTELAQKVPDFADRASNIAMPGFTAPKLLWIAEHEPETFAQTAMVLLPKDYIRFKLSGAFVSDMSDSAGTLWLDVAGRRWDDVLLAACGLSRAQMPSLVEGAEVSALLSPELAAEWGLHGRRIPIAGGGGDNACSAVGIGAVRAGDGFLSLGTSGVVFAVTDHPVALPSRTLHAFCHALPQRWHGMAVSLAAAAALSWIAEITGYQSNIERLLQMAEAFAQDAKKRRHAPVFLPYLTGERTPHNDPLATAQFSQLTIEHGVAALTYAVMEGVAFALADCVDVLAEAGAHPQSCMLVGGGSRSSFWAQLIADSTKQILEVPAGAQLGASLGAARLGMLASGTPEADVCHKPEVQSRFSPDESLRSDLVLRRQRMQQLYRQPTSPL
jgi:xylulokinase